MLKKWYMPSRLILLLLIWDGYQSQEITYTMKAGKFVSRKIIKYETYE